MPVIDYQICLAQSTEGAETWTSISALGGSSTRKDTVSCGMDVVTFKVNSATALTDASAFAYHAKVRIRRVVDGVPGYWFVGRVATIPRHGSGSAESYTMKIEGPWSWFEHTKFRQAWSAAGGGIIKPRVILYCDADGNRMTTGAQIIQAAEMARAGGCPIAPVTSATVADGFTPPFDEQVNIEVADVICKALANHPHAVCWFDYSSRDAVFHVATRQSLPAVSRSIAGRRDIEISQRTDMLAPAMAICYEQSGSVDGEPVVTTTLDYAPVISGESDAARDARLSQVDVVWACFSLQGANVTTASQLLEVAAFPSPLTGLAWWKERLPWLSEYADADISIANARRLGDSSLANLLVSGGKQPWMTSVSVEKERVRADISYIKREGDGTVVKQGTQSVTLEVWVTGASTGQQLYRQPLSIDAGEPVPTGIAAELYAEWSQLHFQGSIAFPGDDLTGELTPGHALNLTGGLTEWASMAAMIIRSSEDADTGETSVEFGVPDWVDVDSRVAFARATRTRNTADSRVWRTGLTANGVTGSIAPALQRDGGVDAAYVRQLFSATGAVRHQIVIDANAVAKSLETTTASVIAPREMLLPFIDTADGNKVKVQPVQVMASALYGTPVALEGADLATETPAAVAATAAVGTAVRAAREDHVHAGVVLATATPSAVGASGAVGESTKAAKEDHVHAGVQLATETPAALNGTAALGISAKAAREDHKHAVDITLPGPGPDTGAPVRDGGDPLGPAPDGFLGTSTFYARRDHIHPVNVDDSVDPADTADTAAPGTSDRYARADHVHKGGGAALDTVAPLADGTAAVGTGTKAAHGDHVHPANVGTATPAAPATAAAPGTAIVYARADHVHPARAAQTGALITMANSGLAAAQTGFSWLVGNAGKAPVKRYFHRYYYRSTVGAEAIVGVQHYEINDSVTGALVEVGPESEYVMHVPEVGV